MNRQRLVWMLPLCLASISVLYGQGAEIKPGSGGNPEDNKGNKGVIRVPKQVGASPGGTVQNSKDHEQSGTHFDHHGHGHGHHGFTGHGHGHGHHGHGHYGDGKYFQYAHNPSYDEYEFGYRRGNDYHFQERYEKRGPYGWNFKTKVKWGDKYAGYGEQYYDYNHADNSHGHGHDDGHGHGHGHGHDEGHYSEQVPTVSKVPNKRQSDKASQTASDASQTQIPSGQQIPRPTPSASPVAELKGEESQLPVYRSMRSREHKRRVQQEPMLTLNPVNGRVTDESTGKTYILKPAN